MADVTENEELEAARTALIEEMEKWEQLHLPPLANLYKVDQLHLTCRVDAMGDLLMELGLIDKDVLLIKIFQHLTAKMEEARPDITKLVREGRQAAIETGLGKLYGPNGEKLL